MCRKGPGGAWVIVQDGYIVRAVAWDHRPDPIGPVFSLLLWEATA